MKAILIIALLIGAVFWGMRHYYPASSHKVIHEPAHHDEPLQPQAVVQDEAPPAQPQTQPSPQPVAAQAPAAPPPEQPEIDGRINEVKAQLRELNQEREVAMVNAQNYQASLDQQNSSTAGDIERQIQEADANTVALQNQLNVVRTNATVDIGQQNAEISRLETEIANQKIRAAQLRSERRAVSDSTRAASAAGNQELANEAEQMRAQRANLESQLRELEAQRVGKR